VVMVPDSPTPALQSRWPFRLTSKQIICPWGRLPPNGHVSAAADPIRSRGGHERSECLRAYHSSAVRCKYC
jgi:hypothetical protein